MTSASDATMPLAEALALVEREVTALAHANRYQLLALALSTVCAAARRVAAGPAAPGRRCVRCDAALTQPRERTTCLPCQRQAKREGQLRKWRRTLDTGVAGGPG